MDKAGRTRAEPPICTQVLIGRQVGEGVPKDRYERELFMNATSARCQAKAADMRL